MFESNHPHRCKFESERSGIRCQLNRHHVDSTDPDKTEHRSWDANGVPNLKVSSEPSGLQNKE